MVVTPFEQVKFSYRSDKAARESDCCGRKGPGQRSFLDVFEVQERRQPRNDSGNPVFSAVNNHTGSAVRLKQSDQAAARWAFSRGLTFQGSSASMASVVLAL